MPRQSPRLSLDVQYAVAASGLPTATSLRRWAKAAQEATCIVTVRFVGAQEAQTLNSLYRGKDYATNVLAFVYDEQRPLRGDIVLCASVLRQEARTQRKPPTARRTVGWWPPRAVRPYSGCSPPQELIPRITRSPTSDSAGPFGLTTRSAG